MTKDFPITVSERLNLNNPTQGTQCGDYINNSNKQRLGERRLCVKSKDINQHYQND